MQPSSNNPPNPAWNLNQRHQASENPITQFSMSSSSLCNGQLVADPPNLLPAWRFSLLRACHLRYYKWTLLPVLFLKRSYLEWWNWRVQVSLARLVTWRLGPVVHRRKNGRRPPGVSGGQWGCTPAGGYIARSLLVECGAGRPGQETQAQNKQGETGCLSTFYLCWPKASQSN